MILFITVLCLSCTGFHALALGFSMWGELSTVLRIALRSINMLPVPIMFCLIARHFKDKHNSNNALLRVEHIKPLTRGGERLRKRNQQESFWIHSLDALNAPGSQ